MNSVDINSVTKHRISTSGFGYYLFLALLILVSTVVKSATCSELYQNANYQQAHETCGKDLTTVSPAYHAELLLKLIEITHELDLHEEHVSYVEKLKETPRFNDSAKYRYHWNNWQGMDHFYIGEMELSKQFFLEALALAILTDNQQWIAKSYNALGVLANRQKDFKAALVYYKKSLDINKQIKNHFSIGKGYTNIGTVYQLLEDYQQAIEYYELSLKSYNKRLQSKNNDSKVLKQIKHANESLLQVNLIIDNLERADFYAKKILSGSQQQLIKREKIPSIINFVDMYINQEQYEIAQYFLDKAQLLSRQENNYFEAEILFKYAKLYQRQKLLGDGIRTAMQGVNSLSANNYIYLAHYYLLLSQLHETLDIEESLRFIKLYQLNREKFLQQKYDTDIKTIQHEIANQQIMHELNIEKIERISADLQVKALNNKILVVSMFLILVIIAIVTLYIAKRRERKYLIAKIEHHKQQLIIMDEQFSDEIMLSGDESISKETFCQCLVTTMNNAINIWEKHTHSNRVELADRSGIWTVSNDDGSLRTRSLDKYLSNDKIPKNPRWRNVIRTCHFILSDSNISKSSREKLEKDLSKILFLYQKLSSNN